MKLEPVQRKKLPKYAAALAAITSAAILTGCRTAGEVATEGTAPDPNAGANIIEQTLPPDDSSEDDGELVLDGEIAECSDFTVEVMERAMRLALPAGAAETGWDGLQRCFADNGIRAITKGSLGTVYIAGLSRGGVTLSEFTNGVNSGWMYTYNGSHPQLGVSQQYLSDGTVIVVHYSDDYTKEEGSEGYEQDDKAVKAAEKLIDAIGSPVTLQSREKIEKARAAYNALSYAQKQKVSNYAKLQQAEEALERLQQAEDKKAAEAVTALIAALPYPVAETDEPAINAARAAYDALTTRQKLLVSNYGRLADCERQLALLKATEEDKKAAAAAEALIDAIPSPLTPEDEAAVKAAREAYDKLTDLQKKRRQTSAGGENPGTAQAHGGLPGNLYCHRRLHREPGGPGREQRLDGPGHDPQRPEDQHGDVHSERDGLRPGERQRKRAAPSGQVLGQFPHHPGADGPGV